MMRTPPAGLVRGLAMAAAFLAAILVAGALNRKPTPKADPLDALLNPSTPAGPAGPEASSR